MASGIEEILTTLYEMVQDAWSLPLGADKCVLERDKVLDLLDEMMGLLPLRHQRVGKAADLIPALREAGDL